MGGGASRAREARGRAGRAQPGDQEEAARAALGADREGVRVRHRGRQEEPRRALRRPLTAARLQHHVRAGLHEGRLSRLHEPRRRVQRRPDPPEQARRDLHLLLARADRRPARGLQGADGLAVPLRLDLRERLPVRHGPGDDPRAGAADPRGQGDDRRPARVAAGVVGADRRRAQGRPARGPGLHRLCQGQRDRLPDLPGDGARPVRGAVPLVPDRPDARRSRRRSRAPGARTSTRTRSRRAIPRSRAARTRPSSCRRPPGWRRRSAA